ncbi:MAG: hypothetical protein H7Y42_16920 [Chitinophagaceae bacterium]|nr:hypothetical protein [Chitinophagaceae bacterium]
MKLRSILLIITTVAAPFLMTGYSLKAQQYKLRQATTMAGMKSESTIYVKGKRKRTEGGGMMGMPTLTTVEQCDLKRTIKINDRKKLYFIEPFSNNQEEIIDEDAKTPVKTAAVYNSSKDKTAERGGVIYMYYNITDTGERKKMYGLTARHVWSTQKIKPSADACMMKDSMVIRTDGWYIDLPEFNCPVSYSGKMNTQAGQFQPTCTDRFVTRRSGKGRLGFPLIETKTMIMGNGVSTTSEFQTSLETLEFTSAKLDSMLFEIPLGYQLAASEDELQDKYDMNEMMKQAGQRKADDEASKPTITKEKPAGTIRIAVYEPRGEDVLQYSTLQQHLANSLTSGSIEAIAVSSEEEAKKYNCELALTTEFIKLKQGSKIGGLLKAIKNTDPSAASSYTVEATLVLSAISNGKVRADEKVMGKFEGRIDEAAKKALEKGAGQVIEGLMQ